MQICSIDPSHGCTICSFDFSSNFKVCTSFFNLQMSTLASNRALNTSFVSLSHLTSDCELSSNLSEANDRSLHASFVSLPHLTSIDLHCRWAGTKAYVYLNLRTRLLIT